ncbi:MAG TPA: metal ABC transporter substrate-binding protein, partial [Trueperaceae bacterium]|nr:metal ABC transporter substrate-binding protein [Trueperaceae bacterium]
MRTCSHSLWRTPANTAAVWRLSRLLAAAVLLAPAASAAALQVTVSLPPYANIVERIGGEHLTVSTLLPPGASPHAFDPTPSQAASLARADLIVMNGGIDAWLDRLVAATAPDAPILVITESIDLDTLA